MAKKLKSSLFEKYKELSIHIEKYNKVGVENLGIEMYLPTLKSAFIKCFDFNFYITKSRATENSFYYTSFLRGICEDLISQKWKDSFLFLRLF